ncbi:MAG: TonB family protein [Nitrospirae bacterium]|nr:TonB family protein [Nitrospirota bacterium]
MTSLYLFQTLKWQHPIARPKPLSVQWVNLSRYQPESKKKIEPVQIPLPPKKVASLPPLRNKPAFKSVLPPPKRIPSKAKNIPDMEQPVQKKIEPPEPPRIEEKKGSPEPLIEPQKVDIAPLSEIDPTYVERMKRTVDLNFNPPVFNGTPKEVTVSFEVLKNGIIKNPKIVKSSKDSYFDMAALRAIFESRRFGQLPADYPSLSVEITCTFSQNKGS